MTTLFNRDCNIQILKSNDSFLQKLRKETINISEYLKESIYQFPKIFNEKYIELDEALNFLKEISVPNKYVCANIIQKVPGWTCQECSKYTDSIFCHECYKKSKNLHKSHHLYFLPKSNGMCGCGEPEALYTFCPQHSGPHSDQKEINDYISQVFPSEILKQLKIFFNTFFQKISYYFILTEKCQYFYPTIFDEEFDDDIINEEEEEGKANLQNKKDDIILLKYNYHIISILNASLFVSSNF